MERTLAMDLTQHHPVRLSPAIAPAGGRRWRRLSVNLSPVERVGRIVIGLAAIFVGIVLFVPASSTLAAILVLLLVITGIDLVVTGALGHCPLYQRLSYVPPSLTGRN